MARIIKLTLLLTILLLALGSPSGKPVEAHHTGVPCGAASNLASGESRCLPYMDRSWAVDLLRTTGQLTWCMNNRASTYPNLRTQIREVLANHESSLDIDWIEIGGTYETPTAALNAGCQVQMNMPEVHGCPQCGGWIHYLNRPVLIEYNPHAGYTLFHTTISHEVVHLYGLHEHYDDANFLSHRNSRGIWAHGLSRSPGTASDAPTVMDFGTGVWRMTAYDVKYTCQSIDRQSTIFVACGAQQEPQVFPFWNGERWVWDGGIENGWSWNPSPAPCGVWYHRNHLVWDQYDQVNKLRGNSESGITVPIGAWVFFWKPFVWSQAPSC